jgi:glycosyltransferase involved in cell wall biosynthesis
MDVSIVIPLLNEEESLEELYQWIVRVIATNNFTYEIVFIDDGSCDQSWEIIKKLSHKDPQVKGIRFLKNFGKSQALNAGFKMVKGNVVITMDADLQDSPEEIPSLYKMIEIDGYDLVSGWKKKRYDAVIAKNLPSKLFNLAARKVSGLKLHDFNCGLKAYRKEVVKNIEVSGQMHRYIPLLAKNVGYSKITEKVVKHQKRKYGVTKFGMSRFLHGFLDLITISFVSKFGKSPMHLFGLLGTLVFFIGFCFAFYLGIDKLFINKSAKLISQRTEFFIAITAMVIGNQFFLAGFLGEMISRSKKKQKTYKVVEKLN